MSSEPGARARPANHLAGETSPYLLQHAHNPVDWFPWGPDALARAKLLDRPIFLSIGYAACHWCHVMERESFEDLATAARLNADFVAIKVDREERPDLDQVYMAAIQALTGGGGWPMSVFLTPDGRPFYGGTYFPDSPRHGLPSFRQVLDGVARAWREDRAGIEAAGGRLVTSLAAQARLPEGTAGTAGPVADVLETAVGGLEVAFDPGTGGWGGTPKFPQPMTIEFLLGRAAAGNRRALAVARRALDALAAGGIHDQLGGGFHRYATDARWLVPHFEQMLYDNAQLASAYLASWAVTGSAADRRVATGILDALLRDFTTADGAFAASLDADTEGEEGATYVWTAGEIAAALGPMSPTFAAAYGVTPQGNWEGRTILSRVRTDAEVATLLGRDEADVGAELDAARAVLLAARSQRAQPARDDKAIAAWNGLAIRALADASRQLQARSGEEASPPTGSDAGSAARYRAAAVRAAEAITGGLLRDGRLRRSWKDGRTSADGVLEDHGALGLGLLALYETTFDERWFSIARALADAILERFADPAGGFFDTPADGERLVTRPKDVQDNATPSGNALAAELLIRLAALTGEGRYREAAEAATRTVSGLVGRYPTAFARWLSVIELQFGSIVEVAIVGDPGEPGTAALLRAAVGRPGAGRVVAATADPGGSAVPLLAGRVRLGGRPTAYVCRDFACRLPVTEPDALMAQLAEAG